jgi:hypothetical protein
MLVANIGHPRFKVCESIFFHIAFSHLPNLPSFANILIVSPRSQHQQAVGGSDG